MTETVAEAIYDHIYADMYDEQKKELVIQGIEDWLNEEDVPQQQTLPELVQQWLEYMGIY